MYNVIVKMDTCIFLQDKINEYNNIGNRYYYGIDVDKNIKSAIKWYKKGAKYEDIYAQTNLGICYLNNNNEKKAYKLFYSAAQKNYAPAQNRLGNCYLLGKGIEKNEETAVEWFLRASQQENTSACANLGYCYYYGKGVVQNNKKALYYLKLAANNKNAIAMYNLGTYYININKDIAIKWLKLSYDLGCYEAYDYLKKIE